MSEVRTSEEFYGQDEYHRAYFHDIDAPAPLREDRVDPNLPDLNRVDPVDPDMPAAPSKRPDEVEEKAEEKVEEKAVDPKPAVKTKAAGRIAPDADK